MNERHLIDPTPELPDDTPIENVRFPSRIRNVLAAAGLKTVGEIRETADETLLSFQDFWAGLGYAPSKNLGLAVERRGQAAVLHLRVASFLVLAFQLPNDLPQAAVWEMQWH